MNLSDLKGRGTEYCLLSARVEDVLKAARVAAAPFNVQAAVK